MLRSLGLGGDGDEVDAIEEVERALGVAFDIGDCERFVTVGDVWQAVLKEVQLSQAQAEAGELWRRVAAAISAETGVDADQVGRDTLLLGERVAAQLGRALGRLRRR